jgi:antitoxin component HigA of HigAB toxin-antitoxin module
MLKTNAISADDIYLQLVRQFPLRRLKNDSHHAAAVKIFTTVSLAHQGKRDSAITDYLDILAGLIDDYERANELKVAASSRNPADVIRHLMAANGLTAARVAAEIGVSQSNLSEMLSGRRDFSKTAIAGLCKRFAIGPQLFF